MKMSTSLIRPFLVALLMVALAATPAAATPLEGERWDANYSGPHQGCGFADVHHELEARGWWKLNAARSEFPSYLEVVKVTSSFDSLVTGRSVTYETNRMSRDMEVIDNGDGTFTFIVAWSGRRIIRGPDNQVLARTAGTTRWATVYDVVSDEVVSERFIHSAGHPYPDTDFCEDLRTGLGL
jgi:hypothetical protein